MDLTKNERKWKDYTDSGLDIHGVSETAGHSIKQVVFAFRSYHNLPDEAWRIKAYGLPGSTLSTSG